MKKYEVTFTGKKIGAIGNYSLFVVIVEVEKPEDILLKLYETHEHIINNSVTWREL